MDQPAYAAREHIHLSERVSRGYASRSVKNVKKQRIFPHADSPLIGSGKWVQSWVQLEGLFQPKMVRKLRQINWRYCSFVQRLGVQIRIPFPGCSVRHCTLSDKQLEKRLAAWYTGCVRELRKSGTARQKLGRSIFRGKRAALRLVFTFFKGRTPWATPHFRQESQYRGDQI
jgi:hypothetical protein